MTLHSGVVIVSLITELSIAANLALLIFKKGKKKKNKTKQNNNQAFGEW